MPEPAAGVMRMSVDDDDQADQQNESTDVGIAETDRSVFDMVTTTTLIDPLWLTQPVKDCIH